MVSIQLRSGWTAEQRRRVTFVTGFELARMVTVLKVEFRSNYALIPQSGGLPVVVRMDTPLVGPGRAFSGADFLRLFEHFSEQSATQIEGEGRELKWKLRARSGGDWVDPQMPPLTGIGR